MHDSNKPLDALTVKRHKEGALADVSPFRGLRLKANKNGTKTWIYRYRTAEKRLRQIKLGDYPTMELSEARSEFNKQRAIRNSHGDPREFAKQEREKAKDQQDKIKRSGYLVSQMIEDYLEEHISQHRVYKGQVECRRMLEHDVTPVLGDMPVIDVKRSHVHDLIQKISRRAPRIASMVKVELNGAFEHAISAGRINMDCVNPTYGVKSPKFTARKRVFSEIELKKFLKWLPSSGMSKQVKDVMMLMLLTGCRGGEVVAMEWKHIDFEHLEWNLPTTKNGLPHTVFLPTQALELLKTIKRGKTGYVFPSPNSPKNIRQHAIVWQVSKYRESAGLDHWTSHDLRRTVGTGLAKLGCSRVVQDRILNHVDSSVSGIYDRHSYDSEAREWWQRWADRLSMLTS